MKERERQKRSLRKKDSFLFPLKAKKGLRAIISIIGSRHAVNLISLFKISSSQQIKVKALIPKINSLLQPQHMFFLEANVVLLEKKINTSTYPVTSSFLFWVNSIQAITGSCSLLFKPRTRGTKGRIT